MNRTINIDIFVENVGDSKKNCLKIAYLWAQEK
jgi:hypothetical protein